MISIEISNWTVLLSGYVLRHKLETNFQFHKPLEARFIEISRLTLFFLMQVTVILPESEPLGLRNAIRQGRFTNTFANFT